MQKNVCCLSPKDQRCRRNLHGCSHDGSSERVLEDTASPGSGTGASRACTRQLRKQDRLDNESFSNSQLCVVHLTPLSKDHIQHCARCVVSTSPISSLDRFVANVEAPEEKRCTLLCRSSISHSTRVVVLRACSPLELSVSLLRGSVCPRSCHHSLSWSRATTRLSVFFTVSCLLNMNMFSGATKYSAPQDHITDLSLLCTVQRIQSGDRFLPDRLPNL